MLSTQWSCSKSKIVTTYKQREIIIIICGDFENVFTTYKKVLKNSIILLVLLLLKCDSNCLCTDYWVVL